MRTLPRLPFAGWLRFAFISTTLRRRMGLCESYPGPTRKVC